MLILIVLALFTERGTVCYAFFKHPTTYRFFSLSFVTMHHLLDNQLIDRRKYREKEMRTGTQQRFTAECKLGCCGVVGVFNTWVTRVLLQDNQLIIICLQLYIKSCTYTASYLVPCIETDRWEVNQYGPFVLDSCVFDSLACFFSSSFSSPLPVLYVPFHCHILSSSSSPCGQTAHLL